MHVMSGAELGERSGGEGWAEVVSGVWLVFVGWAAKLLGCWVWYGCLGCTGSRVFDAQWCDDVPFLGL